MAKQIKTWKTWISVALVSSFDKNDKYVKEFMKQHKPLLEAKVKALIRCELESFVAPFSIQDDVAIEDLFVADVAEGKVDVVDEAPEFSGNTNVAGLVEAISNQITAEAFSDKLNDKVLAEINEDKNQPRPIEITENEKALLLAIRDSEYNDGPDKTSAVWVDCLWGFEGKKKFGGVMASLTKKNLAGTDGEAAWLTQVGLDRIKDEPYKCTIDRAQEGQGYVSTQEKK